MGILDTSISRRNAGELAEELDATGQESETGAVKWVQEIGKKEAKIRSEKEAKERQILEDKRKYKKNPYYESLLSRAKSLLSEFEVPKGYMVDVLLKEDGRLIFGLCKIGFRWYAKGMKICGEPKFDMNCIERLVEQTLISLDEIRDHHELHRTKEGIILPSKDTLLL